MSKKITFRSSEGETFDVDEVVAAQSELIKDMIGDDWDGDVMIPLSNVTTKILTKVIEYCKKHSEIGISDEEANTWDLEFVQLDQDTLFGLVKAANYLNIRSLLDLACQTVADMIKGKTPEEIRRTFNIKENFTPEEEEELRRENQWAFE